MEYSKVLVLISVIAFAVCHANGYKILCAFPTISRSHFIVAEYLMKGLAAKGHNVTVINQYPLEKPLLYYREIIIPPNQFHHEMMKAMTTNTGSVFQMFTSMPKIMKFIIEDCENLLHDPQVIKLMAEETFDMVIVESMLGNSLTGLATHFNCPLVFFSSLRTSYEILDLAGAPLAISHVPYYMADYTDVSSFVNRLKNMMYLALDYSIFRRLTSKYHKIIYERNFPSPKFPTYEKALYNASLYFVSHHFSQGGVRALPPNIIEVSGLQIQDEPTPLPGDLQNWMDNSKGGVIFFSMGSNIKSNDMSPAITNAILNAFRKLKENVLWKFDKLDIPNLPKNVRIEKWLSQIDILQHSNLKLFITHGGLGSVTEAKIYGVPLLLIPIFADQMGNAKTVVDEGWGIDFAYANLTEPLLTDSIAEVLNNPKYRDRATYSATLFRDRPLTPMQTAIFWVEYVIRYQGAPHMRSNANNLDFFQLYSLDVIGFLIGVVLLVGAILFVSVKYLVRKLLAIVSRKRKLE